MKLLVNSNPDKVMEAVARILMPTIQSTMFIEKKNQTTVLCVDCQIPEEQSPFIENAIRGVRGVSRIL